MIQNINSLYQIVIFLLLSYIFIIILSIIEYKWVKDKANHRDANMSVDDIYSMYIQQQQNLIIQQQQQINELYQMNLNQSQQSQQSNHQMSPNMVFQQLQQLQQLQQQQQQQQQLPNPSLKKLPSTKLDPYKILGLSKQYDESSLKKAYLKKAMKVHPDRGGSKDEFQKVSIAYTVLKKKLKEHGEIHHHNELRDNAQAFMKTQPTQHISAGDNFDIAVFNKIYQENRLDDAFDDGYGSWMEQTSQTWSTTTKNVSGEI